jgi:hypothetical protein
MGMTANETPKDAAGRLSSAMLNKGFMPHALHEYTNADGSTLYYRIRLKHPNGEKWIRPMCQNGSGFAIGEPKFPNGKPLYRLHGIANSTEPVFVCEGENTCDALDTIGIVATTSGGSSSADSADWAPLAGRKCIIWPDNDEAGARYAQAVADKLSASVLDVSKLGLSDKGDAVDWLAENPDATASDVLALPTVEPKSVWPDALPLRRDTPPPEPFPLDALGPLLSDTARCMADTLQCPDALAGQSVLAAATLAAQAHADVVIDGRVSPLSGYFVTVAESGERKSAVDSWALKPHEEHQRLLREQQVAEIASWKIEHAAWKRANDNAMAANKKKSREAIAAALREVGEPPSEPLDPMVMTSEPTYEGLVKLLARGLPTLGLFSDEGGRFLGGHAMSADNVLKTAAGLSGLWDAKAITRTRAGDGNIVLYGRRLSMHLMVQPNVAGMLFGDALLAGQGLLGRILAVCPTSTKGSRLYKPKDMRTEPAYRAYCIRMTSLLQREMPLREGSRQELSPKALPPSDEAKTNWIAFHNHVEEQQHPGGSLATISSLASKAAEHALRLAGVLAVVRDTDTQSITADDMRGGITLANFYLTEAGLLHEEATIDEELRTAERVLEWARKRSARFATETLYQNGPVEVRNKADAERVLRTLELHGLARQLPAGVEVDGKLRRNAWETRT